VICKLFQHGAKKCVSLLTFQFPPIQPRHNILARPHWRLRRSQETDHFGAMAFGIFHRCDLVHFRSRARRGLALSGCVGRFQWVSLQKIESLDHFTIYAIVGETSL
jgi:hypothetical protein